MNYLCTHVIIHAKDNENWARFINSLIQAKTTKPHCCQSSVNMIAHTVHIYLHLSVKSTKVGVFKILSLIQVSFCV